MTAKQSIPRGINHWAVFSKSTGLVGSFQSRELAEDCVRTLGGAGYYVSFGKLDRSGVFVANDLREDKTR